MTIITTIMICASFSFIVILGLFKKKMKLKQAMCLVLVFMLFSVLFSYLFDPKQFIGWDILRYYDLCDRMSNKDLTYAFTESEYKLFPVINLFFFIISKIGNYGLISAVPLTIDALITVYLLFDLLSNNNDIDDTAYMPDLSFSLYVFLSIVSVKMAIAGVRCNLAVFIAALAIYWEYIKKEKKTISYILYVVACLTHPFAFFLVILRLALLIKRKRIIAVTTLVIVFFAPKVLSLLSSVISQAYFSLLIYKLNRYWDRFSIFSGRFYGSQILTYVCWFFVIAYLFYICHLIRKRTLENLETNNVINNVLHLDEVLISFSIGALFNYLFIQRIMYIVAFGLLFILPTYLKIKHNKIIDVCMTFVMFYLLFMNDLYGLIVNYTGYYFLAR